MNPAEWAVRGIDRFQQGRRWIAFPLAVVKKFGDDGAGDLAALVAYYGFFSVFPLLMVLVTVLGMALRTNTALQHDIVSSAVSRFPVIGTQITRNVRSLRGSGLALGVGIAIALWSGLGVLRVMQRAMDVVWSVPAERRPSILRTTIRAALMLLVLGSITLASTAAGGASGGNHARWWAAVGIAISLVLNFALFLLAFRILTTEEVSWADVWPGAMLAAMAWSALQALGGYYVGQRLQGASETYGTFAIVIGLLAWIYVGAQVTLFAAEINVVKKRILWPRWLASATHGPM